MKALLFLLGFTTLAAAAEVKTFKLATGEVLVHAFEGGIPLPSDGKWAVCSGAGPAFVPEGNKQYRLNWNVFFKPKGSPALLRDVTRATLQEVSGKTAIPLFDGPPQMTDAGLMILAPENIVSRETYPWLYTPESTMLVLRIILFKGKEQDKVLQPVLIGASVKRQIKDAGVLQ